MPKAFLAAAVRGGQLFTPSVAWKMEGVPGGDGVVMLHQRGVDGEVQPVVGGYGGPDTCSGIVHPTVTVVGGDGTIKSGPALAGMTLAVDMALSRDGTRVAMVSTGNATNTMQGGDATPDLTRVFVTQVDAVTTNDPKVGCMPDGTHAPCPPTFGGILLNEDPSAGTGTAGAAGTMTGAGGGSGSQPPQRCDGTPDPSVPQVVGEPIAVAFDGNDAVVVQSREPAMLALRDGSRIDLSSISRADTGHLIFHANAGGGLACASCHAEGNDDGRTWKFTCEGTRRTQSLHTGLRGTEPFHWSGDQADIGVLMTNVFMQRMSGPQLTTGEANQLLNWIDSQPRPFHTMPADTAAIERGRAIFNDPQAACATCHTAARTDSVDVGTGGKFQVPSLVGIGTRGPFMHNGCAKTLRDRFDIAACGGGDKHGVTSNLTSLQVNDLITFLQSL
jgi:mono/diheme cytochrome c family protein